MWRDVVPGRRVGLRQVQCGRSILRLVEASEGEIWLGGWKFENSELPNYAPRAAKCRDISGSVRLAQPLSALRDQWRNSVNLGWRPAVSSDDGSRNCSTGWNCRAAFSGAIPRTLGGHAASGDRPRHRADSKLVIADEACRRSMSRCKASLESADGVQADSASRSVHQHDMGRVERISHHVGVMYLGRIVELGPDPRFGGSSASYTKSLLSAVPIADPRNRRIHENPSSTPVPSPIFSHRAHCGRSAYDEVPRTIMCCDSFERWTNKASPRDLARHD